MELLKIKTKNSFIYRINNFPQSINNGKLEYWTKGEGYKKTIKYEIITVDLPKRGENISWYDICKIHELYGYEVAFNYADNKICTMTAEHYLRSYYYFYCKVKNLLLQIKNPEEFFGIIKPDYLMSVFGIPSIDLFDLENVFEKLDVEYDKINCTYKNKKCSLKEYIAIKYSSIHSKIVSVLI